MTDTLAKLDRVAATCLPIDLQIIWMRFRPLMWVGWGTAPKRIGVRILVIAGRVHADVYHPALGPAYHSAYVGGEPHEVVRKIAQTFLECVAQLSGEET